MPFGTGMGPGDRILVIVRFNARLCGNRVQVVFMQEFADFIYDMTVTC